MDSLQAWDMLDGVGVPTYGPGARCGFVGIGRPTSQRARVAPDLILLRIAAQTSLLRHCELIAAESENEPQLSARELEVLHFLAEGRSSNAIAMKLSVTPNTVEPYVRRIFQKLMATDRTSAVLRGVARGLVVATDVGTDDAIRRRRRKEA